MRFDSNGMSKNSQGSTMNYSTENVCQPFRQQNGLQKASVVNRAASRQIQRRVKYSELANIALDGIEWHLHSFHGRCRVKCNATSKYRCATFDVVCCTFEVLVFGKLQ